LIYQRQIELLYIIGKVGKTGRTQIQKLEFLSCVASHVPSYDFIPYHFGPYSNTLQNDLDYLMKQGMLSLSSDQYQRSEERQLYLNSKRLAEIDAMLHRFKDWTTTELMRHIYREYPFYALNSTKAEELLTSSELERVKACQPSDKNPVIFTIGYEGKSLEKYLLKLYQNNVRLLVDVRANSFSMKKEFIGSRLATGCKLLNINYIHFPELGIPNTYRKEIPDKKRLFKIYRDKLLPQKVKDIELLAGIVVKEKRVALTCFEACHTDCHRHHLAEILSSHLKMSIPVEHL